MRSSSPSSSSPWGTSPRSTRSWPATSPSPTRRARPWASRSCPAARRSRSSACCTCRGRELRRARGSRRAAPRCRATPGHRAARGRHRARRAPRASRGAAHRGPAVPAAAALRGPHAPDADRRARARHARRRRGRGAAHRGRLPRPPPARQPHRRRLGLAHAALLSLLREPAARTGARHAAALLRRGGPLGLEMVHPEYRRVAGDIAPLDETLTPIYPLTEGLPQGRLRALINAALDEQGAALREWLPHGAGLPPGLPSLGEALTYLH